MKLIVIIYSCILPFIYAACDDFNTGPTIVALPFNAVDDANAIIEEMTHNYHKRKHKDRIVDILLSRTIAQRLEIGAHYNHIKTADFHRDIKSYFGDYLDSDKNVMEILSTTPDFLARRIHHSIKKKRDDLGYMSIMCTSTAEMLRSITASYLAEFKQEMAIDIADLLGNSELTRFLNKLIGYNSTLRSDAKVDDKKTAELVKAIPSEKTSCNLQDTSVLYEMMQKESFEQIKAVGNMYKMDPNSPYPSPIDAIEKKCTSDLKDAFVRIMDYSMDPFYYYAREIERDLKEKGDIDSASTRVMISRSEIDMADIRTSYDKHYEHGLHWAIAKYFFGREKRMFLKIVDGNRNQEQNK